MAQIHYVVVYDTDTGKWEIDDDTTIAKFDHTNIWIPESEEWVASEDELYDMEADAVTSLARLFDKQ